MTCKEFQLVLPELEGGWTIEQEAHLESCSACSELMSDLDAISAQARLLRDCEEPSPRVWNSIEIELRDEGLIREAQAERPLLPTISPSRKLGWLLPLAAAVLIVVGVVLHQYGPGQRQMARTLPTPAVTARLQTSSNTPEDEQLLTAVGARAPAMRAVYEADLQKVNAYIRDAEQSARNDPNDEIAQQYLMNAYEQRAMVYEMALDRSLP
jgi:hypothetical protein